jgi:hypothetical protein
MALLPHRIFWGEVALSLFFSLLVFIPSTSAVDVVRFQNRSLTLDSNRPGDVTTYTLRMQFTTPASTGSLDMLFCIDPIPYLPCDVPTGLDVSGATLASQTGETGWTLEVLSPNHLRLTRPPSVASSVPSTYVFTGIKNPTYEDHSYAIRMASYPNSDGSGTQIDVGAVTAQINEAVMLETQVPPMLIFCVGQRVTDTCGEIIGGNYSDVGFLDPEDTLSAMSQLGVGTNATGGYVVTVHGSPPAAGNRVFPAPTVPTISKKGTTQFGINLVSNTDPAVGQDPVSEANSAVPATGYDQPNLYKFQDGDIIATAPHVSLISRFTVSYILNSAEDLHAGVYTTTITYVCSGRF